MNHFYFKPILFAFLFLLLPATVFAGEPVLTMTGHKERRLLNNFLELLEDPQGKLSVEQVSSAGYDAKFVPLKTDTGRYLPGNNIHWMRFRIRNAGTAQENYLLEVANFDNAKLYIPNPQGGYTIKETGMSTPHREKEVHTGRKNSLAFSVAAGQQLMLYLRVENNLTFSTQNKASFRTYDILSLQQADSAREDYQQVRLFQAMFVGIILIMTLYNFFIFIFFKDRSFLIYVLFLGLLFFYWLITYGFGLEILWPESPRWDTLGAFVTVTAHWFFFTRFTASYLNLKTYAPKWNYVVRFLSGVFIAFLVAALFDYWPADLLMLSIVSTAMLVFAVAVVVVWKGYRPARYFLIANLVYLAAVIVEMLRIKNIIHGNELLTYAPQMGTCLQILLFSVGLADRVNLMRKQIEMQAAEIERRDMEMKLLEKEREAERLRIMEEQKQELERLVEQRTAQLREQHAEMEMQHEEISAQRDYIESKHTELETQKAELEKTYRNMIVLSSVGREIIASLNVETIIRTVYESLNYLMDASTFGIGIYNEQEQVIDFTGAMEAGARLPDFVHRLGNEKHFSVWCFRKKEPIFINNVQHEYQRYVADPPQASAGQLPMSLMYLPLIVDEKQIGVITVQSFKSNAYQQSHLAILETLANYIAIAIDNSVAYQQIKEAHAQINAKNDQIMGSLRYGEKIQRAILPGEEKIRQMFEQYFIIYRAKDVVSGDFYWFARLNEKSCIVAVLDCTGHGVPGAFMSMVGNTLMLQIVNEYMIHNPAQILEELYKGITIALQQESTTNDDGMDVCLCLIEHLEETEKPVKITFAGAKRPLYYVENHVLHELRGDRKSIGGIRGINKSDEYTFTNQEVRVDKGTVLYLTSDGLSDQNNGRREKLGSKRLKQFMETHFELPMKEQGEKLLQRLADHQGDEEQRDDITVVGVRV